MAKVLNSALVDASDAIIAIKDLAIKIQKNGDIKNGVKELSIGLIKCFNSIDTAKFIFIKIKQDEILSSRKSLSEIFNELVKSLVRESKNAKGFTDNNVKLLKQGDKLVALTPYELHIDSQSLSHIIESYIKALIHRFQSNQVSVCRNYSRQLLEDVRNCLIVLDNFLTNKNLSSVFLPFSQEDTNITGLSACILGLLDSGIDVLLSGNAGSGKSTTLEMFARRRFECRKKNEEIIFLPLMKVSTNIANDNRDPLISFCDEIARLFRSAQPGVTQKFIMDRINTASQLVLIFDGIDEASGLIGWLLHLITAIRQLKNGAVQIIASSRFGVIELENAGLIQIQLLPFRPEQVKRFVSEYLCNDPTLSEEVIQHLNRHPTMFSVAQTPMMSTILCVLAKNGVVLPETKNALYKERFELLWGAYDAKKQVHRVRSSRSCLEDVSKKVAYYLHEKRIRSAPRKDILLYIYDALNRKYHLEFIENALKELEQPCNVLLKDFDEKIGFGHLSYQEYLVSEELYSNRHGDIVAHLNDPWWRGVLVLTAMKTEDIGEIIEDRIIQMGVIGNAAATLKAMVEVCDTKQANILGNFLRSQERLDYMDDDDNF